MNLTKKERELLEYIAVKGKVSHWEGRYIYKTDKILQDSFKRLVMAGLIGLVDIGRYNISKKGKEYLSSTGSHA